MSGLRSLRLWASVAVSVFFLWLAFRGQDLSQTIGAIRSADYRYVLPALALYFAGVFVRSVRWKALLSPIGSYTARSLFPVVVIGYMANDVLPARMGEVVRVYVLSEREGLPKASALGTVVVERLLDALTMLLLLAVAAMLVPLSGAIQRIALVAAGALLIGFWPLLFLIVWPDKLLRLVAPLTARMPRRLSDRVAAAGGGFLSGLRVVRSPRVVLLGFGLSVLAWLFEAGMYWTLAAGFGLPVGVALVLLTLAVTNLATLVPAAPGYVGSFHLAALLVLRDLAGLDADLAGAYVIALHLTLVVPVVLLGLVYWLTHNLSLSRLRREASAQTRHAERRVELNAVD